MTTIETRKAVAETILSQLGGKRFIAMTGAKDIFSSEVNDCPALQFKLPANFAKDSIVIVRIALNDNDTYDIEYMRMKRTKNAFGMFDTIPVLVRKSENIYCDMLTRDFTENTGLQTRI